MATEKDFELLDDYISNRLSLDERAEFEHKLASDPTLANEYELQKKIAESIRQARAAELKTMLNNIPVGSIPSSLSGLSKLAVIAATATLVGTGLYFYYNDNKISKPESEPANKTELTEDTSIPSESISPQNEEPVAENQQQPSGSAEKKADNKNKSHNTYPKPETGKRDLNVFDPAEENENENDSAVQLPDDASVSVNSSTLVVETDNTHKKYNFHYQFTNGKLYLFGSFDKNLYEIMEFFSENKRTVFLYYKNNYYLLNDSNEKVKLLNPVNDPLLLKKLREYRTNQN